MTYIEDLVWASCVSDIIICYWHARLAGLFITITYMALLYGTYVPDWEYRISGPGSTEKTFTVSSTFTYIIFMLRIYLAVL